MSYSLNITSMEKNFDFIILRILYIKLLNLLLNLNSIQFKIISTIN